MMIFILLLWILAVLVPKNEAMVVERGRPSKNKSWYNKRRNQGIKVPRGKKPPQWEREGDTLYQEIIQDNPYRTVHQKMSFTQAQILLSEKLERQSESSETMAEEDVPSEPFTPPEEPPFLWGGLSVGPVWKQRLVQLGFTYPTPIQIAAFSPIIQDSNNLILASATGSGKSLAYLLPLLTTRGDAQRGRVWIVTPTTELALQLQRVVANLLNDQDGSPTVQVLSGITGSDDEEMPILSTLVDSTSYILAGTSRTFQQLIDEIDQPIIVNKSLRQTAKDAMKNLEFLVFDEADRLFQTEAVARAFQERRLYVNNNAAKDSAPSSKKTQPRPQRPPSTPLALKLLETISTRRRFNQRSQYTIASESSQSQLRIICASATIGRTLRRQLMEALNTSSMEKAATLITADVRTKKDANARRTSLLPLTLNHAYTIVSCEEDVPQEFMVNVIKTLQTKLTPAPALIFPGRTGVSLVQSELVAGGFQHVYGIEDIGDMPTSQKGYSDWTSTPIYVVSEKLGRGLDLPQLGYVLLLQVPSSAAGYTHLAGRTGRNGQKGTAVTFCRPRETPKLVVIGETLGLEGLFENLIVNE